MRRQNSEIIWREGISGEGDGTESRFGWLPQQKPNSRDRCGWEGRCFIQVPAIWEDGTLFKSRGSSQHLSAGRDSIGRERESRTKRSRGGYWKVLCMLTNTAHCERGLETGQAMVWRASSWFRGWRSANLSELGCLKVRVFIFSS